ncbi:MAG: hypothetical protein FWG51_05070 [Firmicutes bacterium]|nr:hypothetical protein [Bacillota bacterium]
MKAVFDIEAIEDIISKLKLNYDGQEEQKTLLAGEAQVISFNWQANSANILNKRVDAIVQKNDGEYEEQILYLEGIKDDYSDAKNQVGILSTQLLENMPIINGILSTCENIEVKSDTWLYVKYLENVLFDCRGRTAQQIDKIKSAWKDGDATKLIDVLNRCVLYIDRAIIVCKYISGKLVKIN